MVRQNVEALVGQYHNRRHSDEPMDMHMDMYMYMGMGMGMG
eukprot:CAMPEP_0174709834 /NCGR_PEP_ID=MMETSP1094-20130205/11664_1 /TAXON_ID=156173 /ORGANISM="Chrysochromulina brevifilum, Strain UTEX LB 985" /LENGTH=40 /DNA_ID= /DNA_START= /DNA_END= /DNA_ORIENTATION=